MEGSGEGGCIVTFMAIIAATSYKRRTIRSNENKRFFCLVWKRSSLLRMEKKVVVLTLKFICALSMDERISCVSADATVEILLLYELNE